MTAVTMKSPFPHQIFSTRAGEVTSDENGLITGVPAAGSQLLPDLIASGCYVVDTPIPASAPDEVDLADPEV
jgi:hypothetical protein